MNDRERIDEYLRDEVPPDDAVVVVRGGPIAAEKLIEHAQRQARAYTYRGEPMFSISVSLTVSGWDLASLLAGPLSSRSTYARVDCGRRPRGRVRSSADLRGSALRPAPRDRRVS